MNETEIRNIVENETFFDLGLLILKFLNQC